MKFVDEICENCYYFLSKDEIFERIKNPDAVKELNEFLNIEFDSGDRCLRYPDPIETTKTSWCGEWRKEGLYP